MISAIVCVDKNWGIGYKNDLLVRIPEDIKFFREKTTNSIVIMGRKTYDSLPVKPLPNRLLNIVVTSKINKMCEEDDNGAILATMDFVKIYLETLPKDSQANYYIIGGGQIYKELLPYCDTVYVTKINHTYQNVDTYFPNLEQNKEWEMIVDGKEKEYNGLNYKFCTYRRRCER